MLINGKEIAAQIRAELHEQVAQLTSAGKRAPRLDVILVGENPASQVYVRNKIRACAEVGIDGHLISLPDTTTQTELLTIIARENTDDSVDGLLVQLPLPKHIDEQAITLAIAPSKDVDGFHPLSHCTACTPAGVIELLRRSGVEFRGARAVVIGRSHIVGRPLARLLLDLDCTVTVAHSKTRDLDALCREADILVAAVGRPKMITADFVKPGATVIDVGINRTVSGLCGDVDFASVEPVAAAITPVPGGVGPMTIAMLLSNTLDCYNG